MKTLEDIQPFASLLERDQLIRLAEHGYTYPGWQDNAKVKVTMGKKYARVDVGSSGKYMVEVETGTIYGIKAYGVIHSGHAYGSLDTIHEWDWSGYTARPVVQQFATTAVN